MITEIEDAPSRVKRYEWFSEKHLKDIALSSAKQLIPDNERLHSVLWMNGFYIPDIARHLRPYPQTLQRQYFELVCGKSGIDLSNGEQLGRFLAELSTLTTVINSDQDLAEVTHRYNIDEKGLGIIITDEATKKVAELESPQTLNDWNFARKMALDIIRSEDYVIEQQIRATRRTAWLYGVGVGEWVKMTPLKEAAKVRAGYIVVKDLLWSKLAS